MLVLLDIICSEQLFTLAKISKVDDATMEVVLYVQRNKELENDWIKMPSLTKIVSKATCLAKHVTLTKKMVLNKKWKTFLKTTFYLYKLFVFFIFK